MDEGEIRASIGPDGAGEPSSLDVVDGVSRAASPSTAGLSTGRRPCGRATGHRPHVPERRPSRPMSVLDDVLTGLTGPGRCRS